MEREGKKKVNAVQSQAKFSFPSNTRSVTHHLTLRVYFTIFLYLYLTELRFECGA